MDNCPSNNCGKNLKKAYEKIAKDSSHKPTCCVGPTGPRGPIGPTWPVGPAPTITSAFFRAVQTKATTVNADTDFTFDEVPLSKNITYNSADSTITIQQAGTYLAAWHVLFTNTNVEQEVTIELERVSPDTASIGESETGVKVQQNSSSAVHGNAIFESPAGATYAFVNRSDSGIQLNESSLYNTELIIVKIS